MIKVKKGMKPSEVMKAVEEGKQWAWFAYDDEEPSWRVDTDQSIEALAVCIAGTYAVAIIDDSHQLIDWDGFWWEFFGPDRPLTVINPRVGSSQVTCNDIALSRDGYDLRQSPFYPWFGGKQPVPDGVEVEISIVEFTLQVESTVVRKNITMTACDVRWDLPTVVAFRITGRVL